MRERPAVPPHTPVANVGEPSSTEIVPRWEWRTFGERFGTADDAAGRRSTPARSSESDELYLLSVHSDASVKVRDGLMDVKHLQRVDDHGLELWIPVMKAALPAVRRRRGGGPRDARRRRSRASDAPPTRWTSSIASWCDPDPDLRAVSVHKRASALPRRRLHGRADRAERRRRDDPDHRRRVARPDARLGDRPQARARRPPQRERRPWAQGAHRVRLARTRSSTSARTRSSSTSASGTPTGRCDTVVDRAEITRLGEGLAETGGSPRRRCAGRSTPSPRWSRKRARDGAVAIAAVGHRRAAACAQPRRVRRRRAGTVRDHRRGHLGRGGSPTRVRRRHVRAPVGPGPAGRVRLRRRQHAVHVRDGRPCRRAVQRGRRAVRVAERFGLAAAVSADALAAALAGIAADLDRLDGRPTPDALDRHRRHRDEPRRGEARSRPLRPRRRAGHGARPRRDRPPDRAATAPATRTNGARSSGSNRRGPRSSSPARASCGRSSPSSEHESLTSATAACATACSSSASRAEPRRDPPGRRLPARARHRPQRVMPSMSTFR